MNHGHLPGGAAGLPGGTASPHGPVPVLQTHTELLLLCSRAGHGPSLANANYSENSNSPASRLCLHLSAEPFPRHSRSRSIELHTTETPPAAGGVTDPTASQGCACPNGLATSLLFQDTTWFPFRSYKNFTRGFQHKMNCFFIMKTVKCLNCYSASYHFSFPLICTNH